MARHAKHPSATAPPNYCTPRPISARLTAYFRKIPHVWPILWFSIYIAFLILDIFLPTSFFLITALKYLGIFLCFVYAWRRFPQDHLLTLALAFTLLADTVFVVNNTSIIGIFVFCIAQFFHFARLRRTSTAALLVYFVIVLAVFFFGVTQKITPIFIIAAIYAGTLGLNLLSSAGWYLRERSVAAFCALIGFILFALCDCCVATSYFATTAVFPAYLYDYANFFAWAFYLPSQIFISNSSKTMIQ